MTAYLKPSVYGYRGQLSCKGLLFDTELISDATIMSRILQLWQTDACLYQLGSIYILLWPYERSIIAQQALGAPIVFNQSVLATIPLSDNFLADDSVIKTGLWHVKHGQYVRLDLMDDNRIDPSLWLDIGSFQLASFEPLGVLPAPPSVLNSMSENSSGQLFKRVNLSVADAQKNMLTELQNSNKRSTKALNMGLSGVKGNKQGLQGMAQPPRFAMLLAGLFRGGSVSSGRLNQVGNSHGSGSGQKISGSSGSNGFSVRLMLTKLLLMTGYERLLGGKQASYLRKMAKMFEQGDLEEALKYAVPMSDIRDAEKNKHPALRGFSQRASLKMQMQRQQGGNVAGMDGDSVGYLSQLYEQAFSRLDQQGKIKEAAFVLSELLRDYQRAVDYLEKHGHYDLAAELAEGQQLNPERIIKQWILAGNHERAVYIAKMTGCYKAAIDLLIKKDKSLAIALATEFAYINANAGFYKEAIELAWLGDVDNAEITNWLTKAIDGCSGDSIDMLVRYLCVCEQSQLEVAYGPLRNMLLDRTFEGLSYRQSIYTALVAHAGPSVLVPLARWALRSYADDAGAGLITVIKKQMSCLQAMALDSVLGYDFNALGLTNSKPSPRSLKNASSPRHFKLLAAGASNIVDICWLNAKMLLIAKGDAGLDVIRPDGRVLTRLAISCHRIVKSDSGQEALLLANHNQYTLVSKFDASTLTATRWTELKLTQWAASFDGFYWLVAKQNTLWALDVQGDGQQAVWSVNDLPGSVQALNRDKTGFSLACNNDALELIETWRYELPSMLLRQRESLDKYVLKDEAPLDLGTDATVLMLNGSVWHLRKGMNKGNDTNLEEGDEALQGKILGAWVALIIKKAQGRQELAFYVRNGLTHQKARLSCEFRLGSAIYMDLQGDKLVVSTKAGQVACFDLLSGTLMANFIV